MAITADALFQPAVPPASNYKIDDLVKQAAAYVAANEGRRNVVYKDSKGLPTVGIGHLVTPKEKKQYEGRVLSDAEVDNLFAADLASKMTTIRRKLGDAFDALPAPAQVAVVDGFFRGDLSGSPKALTLIKQGKLAEAADEYLDSAEYRASVAKNKAGKPHGVAARMERNAEALRQSAALSQPSKPAAQAPARNPLVLSGPLAGESVNSVYLPLSS